MYLHGCGIRHASTVVLPYVQSRQSLAARAYPTWRVCFELKWSASDQAWLKLVDRSPERTVLAVSIATKRFDERRSTSFPLQGLS